MPSTRDQQLARARAARQAQRATERAKRNRIIALIVIGAIVVAGGGLGIALALGGSSSKSTVSPAASPSVLARPLGTSPSASASPSLAAAGDRPVACGGTKQTLATATRTFKKEPAITIDTKATYTMTLNTSCGPIVIALDAAAAPHTVNLMSFLAADKFYDGSFCHRASNTGGLTIVQCGDPTGTGSGSIGFTIKEENTKGATYPRGTLAMANTGAANSTGSQFFLVDQNASLSPDYTVAGHITSGLDVLDKLIAVGNDGTSPAGGGGPLKTIFLNTVTVTKS